MADPSVNPAPPQEPLQPSEFLPRSIGRPSQPSTLPREPTDCFDGWDTIGEQQDVYNEQDCLHPSNSLVSEKLKDRGGDDVVIFGYSLSPDYLKSVDGNPLVGGGPSLGHLAADDDIFFRVSKNELITSEQFDQIINPTEELRLLLSRGSRLGIMFLSRDFPQCYDTHDDILLNSMGERLGLLRDGEDAFMGAHLQRVRALPGRGRFRTGISLQAPFKKPSELSRSGSSEDRFIFFVSFPYFGGSREEITLGPERESVKLLDFKRLGVDPDGGDTVSGEEKADKGEILVHQARYMIFDNYTMATFTSKEDSAKDQVPLHRFQERIGAFRSLIHMIANRMGSELWTLGKLQASLYKLEEEIDQMISDAKDYEDNQGMEITPDDNPKSLEQSLEMSLTEEEKLKWNRDYERARQNNVRKRKQGRIRDVLTSLNRFSAVLFAAISVAERQIAVLQDLHNVFSTSYRTKTKDHKKGYPLRRNPFYKHLVPIPVLLENAEQIWPDTLDTIDEVIRDRKCFIKKIKELVENMDIRRKILSVFLKSDQAKAAPSETIAQETADAMKRTEETIEKTQAELVQQGQTLSGFAIVTTAFLPLSFCASYFGMNNIKEFDRAHMSERDFWLATGPVCAGIILLTVIIVLWKRPMAASFRSRVVEKLSRPLCGKTDIESLASNAPGSRGRARYPAQASHASFSAPVAHNHFGGGCATLATSPPPIPQSSGSGTGIQLVEVRPPSPSSRPSQQRFSIGAYSTNPPSTRTNRTSLPLQSAGAPSTMSLLAGSRLSDTHALCKEEIGDKI